MLNMFSILPQCYLWKDSYVWGHQFTPRLQKLLQDFAQIVKTVNAYTFKFPIVVSAKLSNSLVSPEWRGGPSSQSSGGPAG